MVAEARRCFPFEVRRNLFLITIGKYLIKLKKLDRQLRASNHPTQLVMDFLAQRQLELFEHPATVNLHLGYQKDAIELTRSRVWLARPIGNRLDWTWDLSSDRVNVTSQPVPFVGELSKSVAPALPVKRVRPKTLVGKKDEIEDTTL